MTTSRAVVALAAAGSLVLAGCSGGGSADSGGSRPSDPTPPTSGHTSGATPGSNSASPSRTATPKTKSSQTGLPSAGEIATAKKDVEKLSDRQLAGQVIVGTYQGSNPQSAAALVKRHHLGGVIVMGDNVPRSGPLGLRGLGPAVDSAMKQTGRDWPGVIATDQEGGVVARLGAPVTQLPGAMAQGAANDPALSTRVAAGQGEELRALGLTMVLAPDADVTTGPADTTIGSRSPGSDPHRVASIVDAQVKGYSQAGVIPVVKHFPGHGSVTSDTHVSEAVQAQPVAQLMKRDWVPFKSAAAAGAPAVMTAHIVVKDVDPNVPGTLSRQVLTGQLRDKLGFSGLIVTDGMNMGAISTKYDRRGAAAVSALAAGADVILMPTDVGASVDAIEDAVRSGKLPRARLVDAASRMVATTRRHAVSTPELATVGSHSGDAAELARKSITQLGGACGKRMIGSTVTLAGGTTAERDRLAAELRRRGVRIGAGGTPVSLITAGVYNAGKASAAGGSADKESSGSGAGSPTTSGVQVALDVPYALAKRPAGSTGLATYGDTKETFAALADVLLGKAKANGKLPVAVGKESVGSSACP